jgi:hypothetical protein
MFQAISSFVHETYSDVSAAVTKQYGIRCIFPFFINPIDVKRFSVVNNDIIRTKLIHV